jgi:hypothetical protein
MTLWQILPFLTGFLTTGAFFTVGFLFLKKSSSVARAASASAFNPVEAALGYFKYSN